jgi:integrase
VWHVEFSLPNQEHPVRRTTGERDKRLAWAKAAAMVEAATRDWSRQEDLFASRDNYLWERAVEDWCRERMRDGKVSEATIDFDGQNLKYLGEAKDGAGRPFFAGKLLRDIDGPAVDGYILQSQALGLVNETIAKRLVTLRQVLASARMRRGSDRRQLIGELPHIPSLGKSRAPAGWGRSITIEEYERFSLALPTCDVAAHAVGLRHRIFELAKAGPVTAAAVAEVTGMDIAYVRSELSRVSRIDEPDSFLRRLREREAIPRGQPLRRYALTRAELPAPPIAAVDQRGWVDICVWTAQHTSDVNDFCPEHFNIGDAPKDTADGRHRLPAYHFLWRNTKNLRRTKGGVDEKVREMLPGLVEALERLARVRGLRPGVPIAGRWASGSIHRDMKAAARRAGIPPMLDGRGRPHVISPNDLRRTAATWLAEGLIGRTGPDKSATEIIAEFLGHKGLDVAHRIYDRAAPARLAVVTSVFRDLHAARQAPAASPPKAPVSDIAPGALRKRK